MIHILSLGAGVQSSTLALMAAAGEVTPMPSAAIFADTQAEPKAVYIWLDWLEKQLPFPTYRVTAGNLHEIIGKQRPKGRWRHMPIPAYIANAQGKPSLANRSCTQDFKIRPLERQVRILAGLFRKRSPLIPVVTQWIGISLDEAGRRKPSRNTWQLNRWPLIEMSLTRQDCLNWMHRKGYPQPPKSSCTFCPYHSDAQWSAVKADPTSWKSAVEIDRRVRDLWHGRVPGNIYLHRKLKPLEELTFDDHTPESHSAEFSRECEGMCGV